MAELCRFDELRIRTGREIVGLINNELVLGICEARQALMSTGPGAVAAEGCLRAKAAYAEACRLIPLAAEITEDERTRVQSRLENLQGMLEALSAIGSAPVSAESPSESRAICLAS